MRFASATKIMKYINSIAPPDALAFAESAKSALPYLDSCCRYNGFALCQKIREKHLSRYHADGQGAEDGQDPRLTLGAER